jgi:hypothetical protein
MAKQISKLTSSGLTGPRETSGAGAASKLARLSRFEEAQSSLVRGTRIRWPFRAQGRRQTILPVYFSAASDASTFVTTQVP